MVEARCGSEAKHSVSGNLQMIAGHRLDSMNGSLVGLNRKRKMERRQIQDLNLPLQEHDARKSSTAQASNYPVDTIILEDDEDDDVQVCSPQSVARVKLAMSSSSRRQRQIHDVDLQLGLQLGQAPNSRKGGFRQGQQRMVAKPVSTDSSDDCVVIGSNLQPPKKMQREPQPVKLVCAICLDAMKEEMSTVCGHVFCRECIFGAIRAQKRCPTCRRKLTPKEVHRIYL